MSRNAYHHLTQRICAALQDPDACAPAETMASLGSPGESSGPHLSSTHIRRTERASTERAGRVVEESQGTRALQTRRVRVPAVSSRLIMLYIRSFKYKNKLRVRLDILPLL